MREIAVDIIRRLAVAGHEAYLVGGCVRDTLLARPVADFDLATPDSPEVVIALLEEAGLRAIPTGIEHGTITAVAGSGGESRLSVSFENTNATCEASLKNLGDAPVGDNVRFYVVDDLLKLGWV